MKHGTAIRVCSCRFSPTVRLNARIAALITVLMARFRITITNLCLCWTKLSALCAWVCALRAARIRPCALMHRYRSLHRRRRILSVINPHKVGRLLQFISTATARWWLSCMKEIRLRNWCKSACGVRASSTPIQARVGRLAMGCRTDSRRKRSCI